MHAFICPSTLGSISKTSYTGWYLKNTPQQYSNPWILTATVTNLDLADKTRHIYILQLLQLNLVQYL